MRRGFELDHQILAHLVSGRSVHVDDQECVAMQVAGVGREQNRVAGGQMRAVDRRGKIGIEMRIR